MKCEDFLPFIDAYVDQEFDERERTEMDLHLASCNSCRSRVDFQVNWKQNFRQCLAGERAPDGLRDRILSQIQNEEAEIQNAEVIRPPRWGRRALAATVIPAAAALLFVFFVPKFTTVAPAQSGTTSAIEQTVDWHRGSYPIEITGPQASNVSGWFRDKVDFPVRLPTFGNDVNLLGGRLAHIGDKRAAYVLYEVEGTRLSVLLFDGNGVTVPADRIRNIEGREIAIVNSNGYNVAMMQDRGVTYAVASELPESQFVELLSSALRK